VTDFSDVGDFHRKFGLPFVEASSSRITNAGPKEVPRDLALFRLVFMLEELGELLEAMGGHFVDNNPHADDSPMSVGVWLPDDFKIDHAKAFDALMDEAYVTYGFAHLLGYPWAAGWEAVQRANMAKERATKTTSTERGGTWDVVKPEGWTPPDIEGVLALYGFGHDDA
jgi:predicted HAD superfamily Cof-like phosphohydrolase